MIHHRTADRSCLRRRRLVKVLGIGAAALMACPGIHAATRSWVNGNGGVFSTPANWGGSLVPGAGDSAMFDLADAGYTVSFSSSPSNLRLLVPEDIVTLDLNANTYSLTNTGTLASLVVGSATRGLPSSSRLTILDGTLSAVGALVADGGALTSAATLSVGSGGNLVLQNLWIGTGRTGTFSVLSGGDATTSFQASVGAESTGRAVISGAGSTWTLGFALDIGAGGTGQMDVTSGGVVSGTFGPATVGNFTGFTGIANVSGAGSRWSSRGLVVGGTGAGSVHVSGGGSVGVVGSGTIMAVLGESIGGSGVVSVDGTGSRFQSSQLRIGNFGQGRLDITGGGLVSSGLVNIGYSGFGAGTATLSGAGSVWSTGNVYVGGGTNTAGGSGLLSVGPGATLMTSDKLTIWSTGTVDLNGGSLQTGTLQIAAGGHFNWSAGQLWITNEPVVIGPTGMFGSDVVIGAGKSFRGVELTIGQGAAGSMSITGGGEGAFASVVVGKTSAAALSVTSGATFVSTSSFETPLVVGDSTLALATGVVLVDGAGTVWDNSAIPVFPGYLLIGRSGAGQVTVSNGASFINNATYGTIGDQAGAKGSLNLTSGAQMSLEYDLTVGNLGYGSLTMSSGAELTNTSTDIGFAELSVGQASLDGAGTRWTMSGIFTVGNFGAGSLTISGGASVTAAESYVGLGPVSSGVVNISGAGSTWINTGSLGYLIVGGASDGLVEIEDGASVAAKETFIGDGFTGVGTVVVTGATFITDTELSVGYFGGGTMQVLSGGVVSDAAGFIASKEGSSGYVLVSGEGSTWNNAESLDVGFVGTGSLVIEDGGVVNAGNLLTVGALGQVQYNSGAIVTNTLDLIGGGDVVLGSGGDKVLRVAQLLIDAPNGSRLDLSDNDLIVDYTGATPVAEIGQLIKTGRGGGAWTGNGLTSSSADAATFALGYGDNTVLGKSVFSGQSVDSTSVLVKFTYYGDANLDGRVDVADLGALASNWQSVAPWTGGDFDYSGFVDVADLGLLASNWQAGVGNPLTPTDGHPWALAEALSSLGLPMTNVPEPGACILLGTGALLALRRRRHPAAVPLQWH